MKGLALLVLALLVQGQEMHGVGGTVVNALTGEPMDGTRVSLSISGRPAGAMTTGRDGRFRFTVAKGHYQLDAERNGVGRQPYGARSAADFYAVGIIVDGTERNEDLVFRIFPPGAISGKVTDAFGEPVEAVQVQLLRAGVAGGKRQAIIRGYAYTDDRGEYRFGNLAAGNYYLIAGGTPWHSQGADHSRPRMAFLPVYYPNAADPEGAAVLRIGTGEEARADLKLLEQEGHPIKLEVTGEIDRDARVTLTAAAVEGLNRFQYSGNLYGKSLDLPVVPPGTYTLGVTGQTKGQFVSGEVKVEAGRAPLQVSVAVGPPPSLQGTVLCDGKPMSGQVGVMGWEGVTLRGSSRPLEAGGRFEILLRYPATLQLELGGSKECYVDRVLRDGKELPERKVRVETEPIGGIVVECRRGLGTLRGFARKGEKKAVGAFVYLAPVGEGLYASYKTDSDGSYSFGAVRPGEYWLYGSDEDELPYRDRTVIAPYLKNAEKVVVAPSAKVEKDVPLP